MLLLLAMIANGPTAAAAARDKEIMLLDGINPLNPFPAGLELVPAMPYLYKYQEPPVPANAYRGVYVSAQGFDLWARPICSVSGTLSHSSHCTYQHIIHALT